MTQSTQRKPEEPITNTNTSGRTIAGLPGYQQEVHHLTSPETFGEPAGSSVRGGFFFLMFLIRRPGHYMSKLRTTAAACWEGLSFLLSQPVCLKATVKYMLEFQHTCTSCSNKQVLGCLVLHFSKSGFWSPSRALLARHGTLHSLTTPTVPQAAPHPCTTQP